MSREQSAYPLLLVAVELDGPQDWAPLFKFVHPVVQGRLGHNHQVRAADAAELLEIAEQGNGLQRLPQSLGKVTFQVVTFKPQTQTWLPGMLVGMLGALTISSARMPLMPLSYRWISQFRPCSWYSRIVPPLITLGCTFSLCPICTPSSSSSSAASSCSSVYLVPCLPLGLPPLQ